MSNDNIGSIRVPAGYKPWRILISDPNGEARFWLVALSDEEVETLRQQLQATTRGVFVGEYTIIDLSRLLLLRSELTKTEKAADRSARKGPTP